MLGDRWNNLRFTKKASLQAPTNPQYYNANKCQPGPEINSMQSNINAVNGSEPPWIANTISSHLMPPPPPPFSNQGTTTTHIPQKFVALSEAVVKEVVNRVLGKEVVNRVLGKETAQPAKLKSDYFRCKECNLFLSGQATLDTHLLGAKHARKLKELELADKSQIVCEYVLKDGENNYRCTLCSVVATSLIHIKSHVDGVKHKTKEKEYLEGKTKHSNKNPCLTSQQHPEVKKVQSNDTQKISKQAPESSDPVPVKKRKMDDNLKFFCSTCNISSNSQLQHDQHMGSKKHAAKVAAQTANIQPKGPRSSPGIQAREGKNLCIARIPLQSSFVPSEASLQYDAWDPKC